jgi:hypothetical protein
LEDALKKGVETGPPMQPISGNQGLDASGSFIPTKTYGSSMPLKADLSKPFLNPKTDKPFTESELFRFTETPPDDFIDFVTDSTVKNSEMIRKKLAEGGFTHIPYVNDFEAKGDLSMIMLIDRPKDSAAVLKGKFGKNDPKERTNPDIMKEDGGVVEYEPTATDLMDKALFSPEMVYSDAKKEWDKGNYSESIAKYGAGLYADTPILRQAMSATNNAIKRTIKEYGKEPSFDSLIGFFKNLMVNEEGQLHMLSKADGGVVSLKDKAVNMNRGPRGIESYVQYMEPGGVVQSIKDYVGSFFEEEPIVPERNIFEEQRVVEQNSPFPKEEVVEPVQTKKEALMDLADREAGLELINKVGFNPLAYKMMQAGLRDNRSLSDFLKIYPTVTDDMTEKQKDDALTKQLEGLGLARGKYFPLDNMVVVEPMTEASAYFQSPTDMIIMHEILHKGAETLTKDPNVNLKSLREKLDAGDYKNIGDDTEGGRAEHRYIQAIVNKAYIDNMLNQVSVYANRGLAQAQKILDNPKSGYGEKVSAEFDLKNIPKYIDRDKKQALMSEIRRSTNQYMEEDGKVKFKKMIEDLHPNKDLFNRDKEDVEDNFTVKELRQVYDLLNVKMLFEPSTIKFISEMSKSAPSGQLMDKKSYSDLFPEQFGDPNRPYEKTYTNITPDMSYFDVMSARDKFIRGSRKENKAEGGVIGLKDKAVKMHRDMIR